MNARSQLFEFALEGRQVDEAVSSVFHSLLFHRTLGKFHYKQEGSYSVGTTGYEDIDCDFIDLTYVRCHSPELTNVVLKEVSTFSSCLRSQEGPRAGQISLTFYQTKKARWPFPAESIPWEVWNMKLEIITLSTEHERQMYRDKLGDILAEKIMFIAEAMNRQDYVPKMPNQSEIDLIFDTRFGDVQPFLFKISFSTSPPSGASMGTTVRRLLKDTLSL